MNSPQNYEESDRWIDPNFFFWLFDLMCLGFILEWVIYNGVTFEVGAICVLLVLLNFCVMTGLINIIKIYYSFVKI